MAKDLDIETYLKISPKKFGIYLLDTANMKHLYNQELTCFDCFFDLCK